MLLTALLASGLMLLAEPVAAASLAFLGPMQAEGISRDGRFVVGWTGTSPMDPVVWDSSRGITNLGELSPDLGGIAYDASAKGGVIVGTASQPLLGTEAFRWTQATGMVGLGDFAGGGLKSSASGVSADGSVVVGNGKSATDTEAYRWTQADGMVPLGVLSGATNSTASGVSSDGSVVVGASGGQVFRWTAGGGMQGLGMLPGGTTGAGAFAVSADGSVIVGASDSANASSNNEAFRWTAAGGMQGLGDLPGGLFNSIAFDVSNDGGVVVGYGSTDSGRTAMIWGETDGMRELSQVLLGRGVDLTGWQLTEAHAVSGNGRVITGIGSYLGVAGSFIAVVPEPGTGALTGLGLVGLAGWRRARRLAARG